MDNMYDRIHNLCTDRGITVGRMCRDLEIPPTSLSELKAGRSKSLRFPTLKKIAEYFDSSVEYLTFGVQNGQLENAEVSERLLSATEKNLTEAMRFCETDEGKYTIEKLLQLTFAERRRVLDYIEKVLNEDSKS